MLRLKAIVDCPAGHADATVIVREKSPEIGAICQIGVRAHKPSVFLIGGIGRGLNKRKKKPSRCEHPMFCVRTGHIAVLHSSDHRPDYLECSPGA